MKTNQKQNGQVLILGVFFTCITLLLTLIAFNTTQTEFEKQQASNIADAAVYSTLNFQARSLNYLAYTNRAIVANHVSVGQLVSTSAWLDYVSEALDNLAIAAQLIPIPGIGQAISALLRAVSDGLEVAVELIPPIVVATNTSIQSLRASQGVVYLSTARDTPAFTTKVIQENDPRYRLSTIGTAQLNINRAQWIAFSESASSSEDIDALADIVDRSRDGWATNRDNRIPLLSLGFITVTFKKTGRTTLDQVRTNGGRSEWVWNARERHARVEIKTGSGVFSKTTTIPLSRGVHHTTNSRRASRRARLIPGYSGIQSYRKLRNNQTLSLSLEVEIPNGSVRTTREIDGIGAPNTANESVFHIEQSAIPQLSAVSSGEIFFERPFARADGRTEYGNLFNPFWIVRLTSNDTTRALVNTARGLTQ